MINGRFFRRTAYDITNPTTHWLHFCSDLLRKGKYRNCKLNLVVNEWEPPLLSIEWFRPKWERGGGFVCFRPQYEALLDCRPMNGTIHSYPLFALTDISEFQENLPTGNVMKSFIVHERRFREVARAWNRTIGFHWVIAWWKGARGRY